MEQITEQILYTSDGMLTKATSAKQKASARRLVVSGRKSIQDVLEVVVSVGTTGRLTWRSDYPPMTKSQDGHMWRGGVWTFTDTATYFSLGFIAGEQDVQGIPTTVARSANDAQVEMLRTLLNHWLLIRPIITYDVCEVVKGIVHRQKLGIHVWKSIKTTVKGEGEPNE